MNRKNQLNSQENFRGAIESVVERKKHDLGLWPPTTEDHEELLSKWWNFERSKRKRCHKRALGSRRADKIQ